MLAEYKIHTSAIFITELTLYYHEILSKTGNDPPLTPRRSRSPGGRHSSPSSYGLS
jgi:hypothetical protein